MDKRSWIFATTLVIGAAAGCAPVVPQELIDARRAYSAAAHGPAMTLAPVELHKAEVSLSTAERAFADDPKAQRTRDLAYVADRKARVADVVARGELAKRERGEAERSFIDAQGRIIDQQGAQLAQTRAQLEAEQRAAGSDDRAKEARENLARLAMVKEEPRGTVITISGSALFPPNQSVLLPDARGRLEQVADALMATQGRQIVVEGYTDSLGSDAYNLDLSRRRAEAVRSYLVSRGYAGELISASGLGKAMPISDNSSAEGRANNRRVEIVVKNKND